jgi:hypothetical protein
MQVYVANASRQVHLFQYRIPENPQLRQREIPPMGQSVLPDDMNQLQVDYLIEKNGQYGFVSADDVKSRRTPKKFTRLIYSVGRPVDANVIAMLVDGNLHAQKEVSNEMRKAVAYESDRQIADDVERARAQQDLADLHSLKFQVEEQEPVRGFERPDEATTNVVYQVAQTAEQQDRRGRGRPRKNAAR